MTDTEEDSPAAARLFLYALHALADQGRDRLAVKAAFELRYAALSGYAPDSRTLSQALDEPALRAARYILSCDLKKILSFSLDGESRAVLCDFTEKYLLSRLERGFSTLDFYHKLGDLT